MRLTCYILLYSVYIYQQQCYGLTFIDLPGFGSDEKEVVIEQINLGQGLPPPEKVTSLPSDGSDSDKTEQRKEQNIHKNNMSIETRRQAYPLVRSTTSPNQYRRNWFVSAPTPKTQFVDGKPPMEDKDENIKSKINLLVQQVMHDTDNRMKAVQIIKEKHRSKPSYRVGFILSMIKKSRDVLNELFNVAVKHRDEWRALEQLKIFELIVHTNVDTSNLVRQLVQIHIQKLNQTAAELDNGGDMKTEENPSSSPNSRARKHGRLGYIQNAFNNRFLL